MGTLLIFKAANLFGSGAILLSTAAKNASRWHEMLVSKLERFYWNVSDGSDLYRLCYLDNSNAIALISSVYFPSQAFEDA